MAKCWAHLQDRYEQNLGLDSKPCPRNPFSKTTLKSLSEDLPQVPQGWLPGQWFVAQAFFRKCCGKAFTTWGGSNSYLLRVWGFQMCGTIQSKVRDPKITASAGECQQTCHLNKPQSVSHLPQNTQLPELPQDALPLTHQRKSILVQELRLLRLEDGKSLRPGLHDEFYISQDYRVR